MNEARSSRGIRLVSILLATSLAGCKVEVGTSGIGGNTDMYRDEIIYFLPDESRRELEVQAEHPLNVDGRRADDERRNK